MAIEVLIPPTLLRSAQDDNDKIGMWNKEVGIQS